MLGWEETGSRMAKREKEEMSPSLSQRIASEPRSWWPWAGLWRKGKDWAPGSRKVQGCSPFHRQVGPGWNEMTVFASSGFQPLEREMNSTERVALLGVSGEDNTCPKT